MHLIQFNPWIRKENCFGGISISFSIRFVPPPSLSAQSANNSFFFFLSFSACERNACVSVLFNLENLAVFFYYLFGCVHFFSCTTSNIRVSVSYIDINCCIFLLYFFDANQQNGVWRVAMNNKKKRAQRYAMWNENGSFNPTVSKQQQQC